MLRVVLCAAAVTSISAITLQKGEPQRVHETLKMRQKSVLDASRQLAKMRYASAQQAKLETFNQATFMQFVKDYKRMYVPGSDEWKLREEIFNNRLGLLKIHHSQPKSWSVGINKFMDYTDSEYNKLLGLKGNKASRGASLLQTDPNDTGADIALTKNWLPQMPIAANFVRDQGSCGSCWALATVIALEGHVELATGDANQLSPQFLVSCVANPQQCGGQGGCAGATAEMAYEHIRNNGIPSEANMPYMSGYGNSNFDSCPGTHPVTGLTSTAAPIATHVTITNWVQLPENKGLPLLRAIFEKGPVVVSADASQFNSYAGGVFAGCNIDAVLNHAVTAMGYGSVVSDHDGQTHHYYLIRNSWGASWGEDGYIRLERFTDDAHFCGTDHAPLDGSGCIGGPATVPVCGMCGVLYDATYPEGAAFKTVAQGGSYVPPQ